MKSKYYSQHGEDVLLEKIFAGKSGTCVEVGANDGLTLSTTKYFEDIGWRCVLVEPAPQLCRQIRANRNAEVHECAASSEEGEVEFHFVEGESVYSSVEINSTMHEQVRERGLDIIRLKVRKRKLDDLLRESGVEKVDFITIDVEGHELDALHGFSFPIWKPEIVIVEDGTDLKVTEVERYMRSRGYRRFYRSGGNDWYAPVGRIPWRALAVGVLSGVVSPRGLIKVAMPDAWREPVMQWLRDRTRTAGTR